MEFALDTSQNEITKNNISEDKKNTKISGAQTGSGRMSEDKDFYPIESQQIKADETSSEIVENQRKQLLEWESKTGKTKYSDIVTESTLMADPYLNHEKSTENTTPKVDLFDWKFKGIPLKFLLRLDKVVPQETKAICVCTVNESKNNKTVMVPESKSEYKICRNISNFLLMRLNEIQIDFGSRSRSSSTDSTLKLVSEIYRMKDSLPDIPHPTHK